MELKELLTYIAKNKLTYVVIVGLMVIQSAFKANNDHNKDKLDAYYGHNIENPTTVEASVISTPRTTSIFSKPDTRHGLVEYAQQFLGRPYKYAAKGPESFDCSGFTTYIFKSAGITLPVSSRLQAEHGEAVDLEDAKPGDLLVFKSPTKGVERVGHVGMVVSNDAEGIRFIHSSTGRGVIIDNLTTSKHYTSRFRGARRVIGS